MPPWILGAVRTGVQALVALVVARAAAAGLDVPAPVASWATVVGIALAIAAWTAAVRWLEARAPGPLRALGRILMLGAPRPDSSRR